MRGGFLLVFGFMALVLGFGALGCLAGLLGSGTVHSKLILLEYCSGLTFRLGRSAGFVGEYPRVCGFTQRSPPYMWRHLLQSLGVPRFPSAGRCTHIGIADHPPRLQTPAAQLTSGAGTRGNAFSHRFGRLDDPKTPEIAQTATRARIRGVYGDSVGRSDRRFCNLRLAYRGQRDPPSPKYQQTFRRNHAAHRP